MNVKDVLSRGAKVCGVQNTTLKINQACLDVVSLLAEPIRLYTRNVECYECNFTQQVPVIEPNVTTSFIIDTNYGFDAYFSNAKKHTMSISFGR